MPRRVNVQFPEGGQHRRGAYAQKTAPFTTPYARNVRTVGPLERRGRGGSRPGLAKLVDNDFGTQIQGLQPVGYVDNDGSLQNDLVVICDGNVFVLQGSTVTQANAYWVTDDGDYIITDDGDFIVFEATVTNGNPLGNQTAYQMAEKGGQVYIADTALQKYVAKTDVVEAVSGAPGSQPLVCVYQERVVLTGADHMFYMSAMDDDTDWTFADEMGKVTRAVAGRIGGSAITGAATSLLSWKDEALLFGTADKVWVMYGNPAGEGSARFASEHIGPITAGAMAANDDGLVLILGRNGLYTWQVGSKSAPTPYTDRTLPDALKDIATSTTDVLMQFDERNKGFHVFLTPAYGTGTHYWIDVEHKGIWPVELPSTMQPYALCNLPTSGESQVILGCADGYLRRFLTSATDDDGTSISSELLLGPFHVSQTEGFDGQVAELVGSLGAGSGEVTWTVVAGNSAEETVDLAVDYVTGEKTFRRSKTGDGTSYWVAGTNKPQYPRTRGQWAVLWLSSTNQWAYETAAMAFKRLGRLRHG